MFDKAGKKSELKIDVSPNKLAINEAKITYADSNIAGRMNAVLPGEDQKAVLDGRISITQIDLKDAFSEYIWGKEGADSKWSKQNISLMPLHYYDGE